MNKIEKAVLPLKTDAIARAAQDAGALVAARLAKLEAAGWDLNEVAPKPSARNDSRESYLGKQRLRQAYEMIVGHYTDGWRDLAAPVYADEQKIGRFIELCKEGAAAQYDAFVAKLVTKIGPVTKANLNGNHVWACSILKVITESGETQNWKTQQIVNCSKLGTLFNQWPTRKTR
jgi:hypothetical protein